jgi:membrane associated rhomboid family serine protease
MDGAKMTEARSLPSPWVAMQRDWWAALLGPAYSAVRRANPLRVLPVTSFVLVASLVATSAFRLPGPQHDVAPALLVYRGQDLYDGGQWRLPTSALLAQSWQQWLWTALMCFILFAPLEVRIGSARFGTLIGLSHVVPTVAVGLLAPAAEHGALLERPDYGTSCLVVGAAAALAWVLKSRLIVTFMVVGLALDGFLNAPATIIEHVIGIGVGVLAIVWSERAARPSGLQLSVIRTSAPSPVPIRCERRLR